MSWHIQLSGHKNLNEDESKKLEQEVLGLAKDFKTKLEDFGFQHGVVTMGHFPQETLVPGETGESK